MSIQLSILRAAQVNPAGIAIRHDGRERSWAEVAGRVARIAGGLRSLGLRPGDHLAIVAANIPEHMEVTYAAAWAGLVVVPVNTRLACAEIADILRRSGAMALAFDRRLASIARESADAAAIPLRIILDDPAQDGEAALEPLLAAAAISPHPATESDLFGIYYTGGTTGIPKGVELTHGVFHVSTLDILAEVNFRPDSVYLHSTPFFHLADCGMGFALTYAAGTHCFQPDPGAAQMIEAIRTQGINAVMTVPTGFGDLIGLMGEGATLPAIRNVVYGAAPISTALLARMMAAFPSARIVQFYGQTEVCGCCTALRPEDHVPGNPRLASAGRATLSAMVRIGNGNGGEAARGTAGEIEVAGFSLMRGYRDMPEITAQTIRNGWLGTGDVGVMDDDGYLYVVDRMKDMIVTGGENVFCAEVEEVLMSVPGIAQAAVYGVPDPRWGEAVQCAVVPVPGHRIDIDGVLATVRGRLAGYKTPKGLHVVESLPLSAVGKVRKDELRRQHLRKDKDMNDVQ